MHKDDNITNEDWAEMCSNLDQRAKHCLSSHIAHGMTLTKHPDGVRVDSPLLEQLGEYGWVANNGDHFRRLLTHNDKFNGEREGDC